MSVLMPRQLRLCIEPEFVQRLHGVIVPMPMRGTAPVAMGVRMPRKNGRIAAHGRVERVAGGIVLVLMLFSVTVLVVPMVMVVLGELRCVGVSVTAVIDGELDGEPMGLRRSVRREIR
jgi:hypothetical protein